MAESQGETLRRAEPVTEAVDLYRWCRERVENFREWEDREMAMFPSAEHREVYFVEWVIRTLGNPEHTEGDDVVRQIAKNRGVPDGR